VNLPTGLPITPEDWEKTPPSVQMLVITLWEDDLAPTETKCFGLLDLGV
jgi:hypothetical protein